MVEGDSERVVKGGGQYRSGTHVISVSMEPGYNPPSASMNPDATVAPMPTQAPPPQPVQAPAASTASAPSE